MDGWVMSEECNIIHHLTTFFSFFPSDAPRSTSIQVSPLGVVSEGGSVTLSCSSEGAPPVESFAWFKGITQSYEAMVENRLASQRQLVLKPKY